LADGLVVQNHARDALHPVGGAEQEFAIIAPVRIGGFDADLVEALFDRARALVGRENAPPLLDHRLRRAREFRPVHHRPSCFSNTATPGSSHPSSHSRKAPPAVETYVNLSATPAMLSAATVSPP